MSAANFCNEFRPHHLRPDKCRTCFGDKSRHGQAQQINKMKATSEEDGEIKDLNREQLIEEFKKCKTDRDKYKQIVDENVEALKTYEAEIDKLRGELGKVDDRRPSSTEISNSTGVCDKCKFNGPELSAELTRLKQECEKLQSERDQFKEELKALEKEMEEMHDNFKEDESEQFEQIKQELDVAMKNCKILQIRLNKSERQYNQLEQVKTLLEKQLEDGQAPSQINNSKSNAENGTSSSFTGQRQSSTSDNSFVQLGLDYVKLATTEYDQLLRDLNDTIEREKDLQEQIKYSQEEAQLKGDRLQAAEAENEILLNKINKLTSTNSKLIRSRNSSLDRDYTSDLNNDLMLNQDNGDIIEQNEQLKLALDLAQSESGRLRLKLTEVSNNLESKEAQVKDLENKRVSQDEELTRLRVVQQQHLASINNDLTTSSRVSEEMYARLEFECRQVRSKLVRSERECKQLKAQLELSNNGRQSRASGASGTSESTLNEQIKQLREHNELLRQQNSSLEKRIELVSTNQNVVGQTVMENDLLEKLKKQLDSTEKELANAKGRYVELDLEHGKLQRQYKKLIENLESSAAVSSASSGSSNFDLPIKKLRLPSESTRDAMSRQDLRQLLKDIEEEVAEWIKISKAKDCLIKDLQEKTSNPLTAQAPPVKLEDKLRNYEKSLELEQSTNANLKIDLSNLQKDNQNVKQMNSLYERERMAMEDEVEKLRQVNQELRQNLEELKKNHRVTSNKLKEVQFNYQQLTRNKLPTPSTAGSIQLPNQPFADDVVSTISSRDSGASSPTNDILLMARDLSELKVKNGFLMRQLEIVREDTNRQLEDMKQTAAVQQRRSIELAQLELKEKHLMENQTVRDELNDLKQKLTICQRQVQRNEEEVNSERDKTRSIERDFRRDRSQLMQKIEQLEAQLAIERRSNEFKMKEFESLARDKERELLVMQDKCVQLERDLKRMHNKFNLMEENNESKFKSLTRDLETKKKELSEAIGKNQMIENDHYELNKRYTREKAVLNEALESIKRSYDEKMNELKSLKDLLQLRQEQTFKERNNNQDRIDQLNLQLMKMSEYETQTKLLKHQLHVQEKQFESMKREMTSIKEDKLRFKNKCDDLERRCQLYEKQELISKTSTIGSTPVPPSTTNHSFLRSRGIFSSSSKDKAQKTDRQAEASNSDESERKSQSLMIEKLSSKINDQRHLINMLKQQHFEAQLELKQLKLLESSERNKLTNRIIQLQSQLNESQERLMFESSNKLQATQSSDGSSLIDNLKRKLEIKWNEERQTILSTIQQQQQQNDSLLKDLKKINQSYDVLRLELKQMESLNKKLSKKLIEYQQLNIDSKLNDCLASRKDLELTNNKLIKTIHNELKPLMETVKKILTSLDANDLSSSTMKKQTSIDSNSEQQQQANLNSTHRPLMTSSNASSNDGNSSEMLPVKSAQPAHQMAQQTNKSRLSKFLTGSAKAPDSLRDNKTESSKTLDTKATAKTKTLKRVVRVKSSALGITVAEKKELRKHLQELNCLMEDLSKTTPSGRTNPQSSGSSPNSYLSTNQPHYRASSEISERPLAVFDSSSIARNQRGVSYTPTRTDATTTDASSAQESPRVVHWAKSASLTATKNLFEGSDLDSEQSFSIGRDYGSSSISNNNNNSYKRFPQTAPVSHHYAGYSLTDYDSETSLASDCSSYSVQSSMGGLQLGARYPPGGANSIMKRTSNYSGAESDSGLSKQQQSDLTGKKKRSSSGLKLRLTSTLRNISRSISGNLASDSDQRQAINERDVERGANRPDLREIRV